MLWLWPAAITPIGPLAWEPPYAAGVALKSQQKIFINVNNSTFSRSLSLFFYCLFSAAPMAHGGSQARGQIRAAAIGLCQCHSNPDPSPVCKVHSSQQCQTLNPLLEDRDRTCILMDTSQIRFHCATKGTPPPSLLSATGCIKPHHLRTLHNQYSLMKDVPLTPAVNEFLYFNTHPKKYM